MEQKQERTFSLEEKKRYYKKKWLREHTAILVALGILIVGIFVFGFIRRQTLFGYISVLLLICAHGWRNNAMMTYVEKNAFDGSGE